MNSREFAKAWLERESLVEKDSDLEGWLGDCIMTVVHVIATQGHSGASVDQLIAILSRIYADYSNGDSPLWQAYWESDEGKRHIATISGKTSPGKGR